jgi:putative Mn2+ efflux pump MntP
MMSPLTLGALAAALGADAFSLCIGIGLAGVSRRNILLITVTVILYHIFMPLIGWQLGEYAGRLIGRAAVIAGAVLLAYLGGRMIWEAKKAGSGQDPERIRFNVWGILLLGASVSMDALSVGFTLGTRQVNLISTALVIGAVAGAMTFAGLVSGRYLGAWVGARAQFLGGLILIAIGINLFMT